MDSTDGFIVISNMLAVWIKFEINWDKYVFWVLNIVGKYMNNSMKHEWKPFNRYKILEHLEMLFARGAGIWLAQMTLPAGQTARSSF